MWLNAQENANLVTFLKNNSLMEIFIFCAVYHGEDDPTNHPVFDNRPIRSMKYKTEKWQIFQNNCKTTLRKKNPYSELFWSVFFRMFPHSDWIRRDTEYLSVFSPNAGKCGKNADQNNSECGDFYHYYM